MAIKQLNCQYMPQEDRLLFRLNTDNGCDYPFLLTRRITLFILSATERLVVQRLATSHEAPVAKAINQFEGEAARETVQFHDQYEIGSSFPLGEAPLLVRDASCKVQFQDGKTIVYLDFLLGDDKTIGLQLWGSVYQNMRILLGRMVEQALWLDSSAEERNKTQSEEFESSPNVSGVIPIH
jgi:hypothetical protein